MAKIANQYTTTQTMWQDIKILFLLSLVQDFVCLLDESNESVWKNLNKKEQNQNSFAFFIYFDQIFVYKSPASSALSAT